MTKYEVIHTIVTNLIIGEYEADSKEEAEELAMDDLPLNTDDYIEREEFIVEEVEDE